MGMNKWRILLFPFSIIYALITLIRNKLFDWRLLPIYQIQIPSIGIGNLSVGGTGKTVAIDFLITNFKKEFEVAVLSRGYGRNTKGVIIANQTSSSASIGDEPFQFFLKHKEIKIVVAEKRLRGFKKLIEINPKLELLLLDDVMQHRYVSPSVLILTTTYERPYFSDRVLPVGNLREVKSGVKRADIILVTKCPDQLSENKIKSITNKIGLNSGQKLFFTKVKYSSTIQNDSMKIKVEKLKEPFVLVTGISDPSPLVKYFKKKGLDFIHLEFPNHHYFTKNDLNEINKKRKYCKVITTEKDFTRLASLIDNKSIFYIPIEMEFLSKEMEIQFRNCLNEKIQMN